MLHKVISSNRSNAWDGNCTGHAKTCRDMQQHVCGYVFACKLLRKNCQLALRCAFVNLPRLFLGFSAFLLFCCSSGSHFVPGQAQGGTGQDRPVDSSNDMHAICLSAPGAFLGLINLPPPPLQPPLASFLAACNISNEEFHAASHIIYFLFLFTFLPAALPFSSINAVDAFGSDNNYLPKG